MARLPGRTDLLPRAGPGLGPLLGTASREQSHMRPHCSEPGAFTRGRADSRCVCEQRPGRAPRCCPWTDQSEHLGSLVLKLSDVAPSRIAEPPKSKAESVGIFQSPLCRWTNRRPIQKKTRLEASRSFVGEQGLRQLQRQLHLGAYK